jgi:SAM-dependent methyltransferase/DNA-binding HxlR family transcriptional regulator
MPNKSADLLRAIGDSSRLRILTLLRSMELTVGELAQVLGQSQPRMSQHLKALLEAELIERRKEGNSVFVSLGRAERIRPIFLLLDAWSAIDGEDAWFRADRARLEAIRSDRASEAQIYIQRYEARWHELRSTHVPDKQVETAIRAALAGHRLGRLVDVGTGTGRMLTLLAAEADYAIGIDRSPDMLKVARAHLAAAGTHAELRQADMYSLPFEDESADTIILHQVLHYAHHPEAVVAEAARVLAPAGRLLIVDVSPHDREDFRERFGHARLGFSDALVLRWMREAGLKARVCDRLVGGELTVTLWSGDEPKATRLRVVP